MKSLNDILSSLPSLSMSEKLVLRDVLDGQLHSGADVPEGTILTAQEWSEDFRRWAGSHRPLPQEADDSRDSIYEGRGE